MRNALWLFSALAIFTSGCFFRVPAGSYSSPAHHRMSRDEAVDYAYSECRQRRLDCQVRDTDLQRGGRVWKVQMRAFGQGRKGYLDFKYDTYSRRLLDVDTRLRPWRAQYAPRWHVDRDWDDDFDGVDDRKERRPPRRHSASNPGRFVSKEQKSPSQQKKAADDDDDDDDSKSRRDTKSATRSKSSSTSKSTTDSKSTSTSKSSKD